jgi:SAM-dependent methyltransferase
MLSRDAAQSALDTLYAEVNGYNLSFADRTGARKDDPSLTYGEMLLDPFLHLMSLVGPQPGETFFDLGSGTGKVVMMAHLTQPFARVTGIELLPGLHASAAATLDRYEREVRHTLPAAAGDIALLNGDMLVEDLTRADVIFVHSTCMTEALIGKLGEKVKTCKPTTRFVLISRGFFFMPWLECCQRYEYTNSWKTQSIAYVYKLSQVARPSAAA